MNDKVSNWDGGTPTIAQTALRIDPTRRVRQMAFDRWESDGVWPAINELQRAAEQRNEDVDILETARKLDRSVGWIDYQDLRLVLRVRGFADLDGAAPHLDIFIKVVRLLYDRYVSHGEVRHVSDTDIRDLLDLSPEQTRRIYEILDNEWFLLGSGQFLEGGSWSREPSPNIRRFRSIRTAEDYLRVADEFARSSASTPEAPQGQGTAVSDAPTAIPGLNQLHPDVLRVAGGLFANDFFAQSVFEALKALEIRLRTQTGISAHGFDLVAKAFDPRNPRIRFAPTVQNVSGDEQEAYRFLFMGAMRLRNLGAHDFPQLDSRLAADYLAFVSLLLGKLDGALPDEGTETT